MTGVGEQMRPAEFQACLTAMPLMTALACAKKLKAVGGEVDFLINCCKHEQALSFTLKGMCSLKGTAAM